MIRLAAPAIPEQDLRAVREVLTSGWLVQGEHVSAFEQSVADFLGTEHAIEQLDRESRSSRLVFLASAARSTASPW